MPHRSYATLSAFAGSIPSALSIPLVRLTNQVIDMASSSTVVAVVLASDDDPRIRRGSDCVRCCGGAGAGGEAQVLMTLT